MKIALIGAGPIGLEMALALKANEIDYIHFEAHDVAHSISILPDNMIFFSPPDELQIRGYPLNTAEPKRCTKEEYHRYLLSLVEENNLAVQTKTRIQSIHRQQNFFTIATTATGGKRQTYIVEKVIIATGGLSKPRLINVPGERLPHVSHYFLSSEMLGSKRTAIIGGGNSAIEAAIQCYRQNVPIVLSYRREKLDENRIKPWLLKVFNALVEEGHVEVYFNTIPVHIKPKAVVLRNLIDESRVSCPADAVLLLTGYYADMTLCSAAGVILDPMNDVPQFDPDTMETNIPGLYVVGTVTGGSQTDFNVFIHTCHKDVDKIITHIQAHRVP